MKRNKKKRDFFWHPALISTSPEPPRRGGAAGGRGRVAARSRAVRATPCGRLRQRPAGPRGTRGGTFASSLPFRQQQRREGGLQVPFEGKVGESGRSWPSSPLGSAEKPRFGNEALQRAGGQWHGTALCAGAVSGSACSWGDGFI